METLIIHGFLHLCGYDHEQDEGEMLALQAQLEKDLLSEEPLPMTLRRGRKPGSKIKVLKDGSRVVVTGRAAKAIERKELQEKVAPKKAEPSAPEAPKRKPGRPRKAAPAPPPAEPASSRKTQPRKRKPARVRSGIIA